MDQIKLRNVRINQLSDEATAWLLAMLHALDSKDIDAYVRFMNPKVTVIFNNGETSMTGRDEVYHGLSAFWKTFGSLTHEELNVYGTDQRFVHEALNHYETLNGRKVTIRAVAWVDRDEDGLVESLRLYNDQSPLWKS